MRKAEDDYRLVERIVADPDPLHDQLCFHCQQSAEKYLKALLEELGLRIPRTHILKDLLAILRPHHPSLSSFRRGLTYLTRFAVEIRYPGDSASKRQAMAARRWAGRVRDACRASLGIRPPRRRTP